MNKVKTRVLSIFLALCIMSIGLIAVSAEEQNDTTNATQDQSVGSVLFTETFSSDISNWKISGGDKDKAKIVNSISGNMLYLNQLKAPSTCEAIANGDFSDFALETEFRPMGGSYFGWFFRYESGYKTYLLQYYSSSKEFKLLRGNGTAFIELASKTVTLELDTMHTMRITAFGDVIQAYFNGEELFSVKDDVLKAGKVGFRVLNSDVYFGNVMVATSVAALEAPPLELGSNGELLVEDFEDGAGGWKFAQNPSAFAIESVYDDAKLKFLDFDNMLETGTMLYGNNAWEDYSFDMEVTPVVSGYVGVLFCYRDAENHYLLQFYGNGTAKLLKKENSFLYQVVASAKCGLKQGAQNKIAVDVDGDIVTVSVGDKTIIKARDNASKVGKIGIRGMYSMFYVDNIKVVK